MRIVNVSKGVVLAEQATIADTFLKRAKGLLGKKELNPGVAMVIKPCNSIHTFFMRFPIDVLFVDKENKVVKVFSVVKPFRISAVYFSAYYVVELPAGVVGSSLTCAGDIISVSANCA